MSLQISPEGQIDRKILQAVAAAIKSIETVAQTVVEYDIGKDDAELLASAMSDLWSILEINGYTIDINTNRLRRATP
jgi:protoporphyrinogen oxidase